MYPWRFWSSFVQRESAGMGRALRGHYFHLQRRGFICLLDRQPGGFAGRRHKLAIYIMLRTACRPLMGSKVAVAHTMCSGAVVYAYGGTASMGHAIILDDPSRAPSILRSVCMSFRRKTLMTLSIKVASAVICTSCVTTSVVEWE